MVGTYRPGSQASEHVVHGLLRIQQRSTKLGLQAYYTSPR